MPNVKRFKRLRRVYRAISMKEMNKIIERQKSRGWVPVSDVVEMLEASVIVGGFEPYRFKVVMEFRGNGP
ncbi:hypothetical protein [Anoxybacillus sp. FSL W8-1294]|uniref:hypothetical protein n=1 Tax=Anoxybacillus sp. FSL W8-1294 TaxID=2954655 RepID=UPI0030D5309E